ncbi:putative transcription factor Rap1 [Aspergillus puulaauensis]|uniref:DNA-binding protein RAP1 n=1 Tax=Aspergillus puulaauensis TaxID=1220207 RepID=A0A7R7XHG8_9EURO|nr:uncharacterized protein APUU_21161S [Aspergillus puulaauensis]BCS20729.1 hypothetical protein APUU_21161S [Aspergillus puulaauensis]
MASNTAGEAEQGRREGDGHDGIFQGMSFWLSENVPQKRRFKELIQQNDGVVKLREKDAGVLIVDHKRKNLPPNAYSYQFIEKSIQKGILEDLEVHKAGPSTARPVGATNIQARSHRLAYTIEDDQSIFDYVQQFEKNPKASISGNKIYEEFAAQHPRHTFQSWRDRYLKRLRGRPRPGGMIEPTAATADSEETRRSQSAHATTSRGDQVAAERNTPRRGPQERKRKRSPEPTESGEREPNRMASKQQTKAANQHPIPQPPEVVVPHESLVEKRKSPRRGEPPSPKKAKITTQQPPEVAVPHESLVEKRKSPRREEPPSPKKAKITTQQNTETAVNQEYAGGTSIGIDNLFLELPFLPPSPAAEEEEEAPEQDIESWIDNRLREGKGDEAQIIESLRCTSMDPTLADKVLDSIAAGNSIPADMRGVWTAEDDRSLEAQDTREIQRLMDKHGSVYFDYRWEYLNMARAEGLENPSTT